MGVGCVWEISVPSAQLCCEPKTALKNKVYLKKETRKRVDCCCSQQCKCRVRLSDVTTGGAPDGREQGCGVPLTPVSRTHTAVRVVVVAIGWAATGTEHRETRLRGVYTGRSTCKSASICPHNACVTSTRRVEVTLGSTLPSLLIKMNLTPKLC